MSNGKYEGVAPGAGLVGYGSGAGLALLDTFAEDVPFVEAVAAKGAAIRDGLQIQNGVMRPTADGTFSPKNAVIRAELSYSLVQSLGLQEEALARNNTTITVQVGDQRIPIEDAVEIPAGLEGYVQVALDMNILNAYFTGSQGSFDLEPTIHATFKPAQKVTRAEFAVAATRFFSVYLMP
jgi:serine protease AprX